MPIEDDVYFCFLVGLVVLLSRGMMPLFYGTIALGATTAMACCWIGCY